MVKLLGLVNWDCQETGGGEGSHGGRGLGVVEEGSSATKGGQHAIPKSKLTAASFDSSMLCIKAEKVEHDNMKHGAGRHFNACTPI